MGNTKIFGVITTVNQRSSNPGDLVLDPFCGCATACVAAELENRQWIGIDICEEVETITNYRLEGVVKPILSLELRGQTKCYQEKEIQPVCNTLQQ
ncbi:MAG: DNA methyltransferase [Flavobacteriaceae bacterium]|nr:DNA methyltransferase [Flavobacteriaceae bacterium]